MIGTLRAEKYATTKEEAEVLVKCSSRVKKHGIQGFIAAGSAVWSVTGGFNLMQRLTATVAGAAAGAYLIAKHSVKPCIEDILALDGSHLQERLAAILQREQAHNVQIRTLLEKHYYLEPLYDDSSQDTPGVVMRRRELAGVGVEKPSVGEGHSDEDTYFLQKENRVPELKQSAESVAMDNRRVHADGHAHMHVEGVEDPFDMLAWTEPEGDSSKLAVKGKASQRRKSKMGVIERREYNRMRYLQWQEKRSASEHEDPHFDS